MASNQLDTANRAATSVKDLITQNWSAIQSVIPETIDRRRFANLVANSVRKTPALAQATPVSLIGSMLSAAALGLEVDTPLQEAYLLPYKRRTRDGGQIVEAQMIIGYQGVLRLFRQHPDAADVSSGWVGEHDEFDYSYGIPKMLRHVPAKGDRGAPVAFWASYTLANGASDFVVLTPAEVAELRGKDIDAKREVRDPQHWMERKTALKQVLKTAPKSTNLASALRIDEQPASEALHMQGLDQVVTVTQVPDGVDPATGEITKGGEQA